jgi:hypothetical protein
MKGSLCLLHMMYLCNNIIFHNFASPLFTENLDLVQENPFSSGVLKKEFIVTFQINLLHNSRNGKKTVQKS